MDISKVIYDKKILDIRCFSCPPEVKAEARRVFADQQLYFHFNVKKMEGEGFPAISRFLQGYEVNECLIHSWW